jgi:hypothetical protein
MPKKKTAENAPPEEDDQKGGKSINRKVTVRVTDPRGVTLKDWTKTFPNMKAALVYASEVYEGSGRGKLRSCFIE